MRSATPLRLYRELADWYPLLTPVGDSTEEAAFYRRLFEAHCRHPPRTLLDLGSGGGHNAAHLKAALACTLVDLEPAMLISSAGFEPLVVPFEHSSCSDAGREVFLGLRPAAGRTT